MEDVADDGRMSGFESLMWTLDGDERLSSTVANLTLLDQAPDWERLTRRLARAAAVVPRLRQRVEAPPTLIGPPRWCDVSDFQLSDHVRRIRLTGRRSRRALLDRVMELFAEPLDRDRPLWDFVVIEGLPDGRAAMLQRIHHSLTDGEGGLRLSLEFIDLDRDAPEPEPLEPPPPTVENELPFAAIARLGWDLASSTTRAAVSGVTKPGDLLRSTRSALEVTRSTLRQASVAEHRLSPLWTERSLERRLDIFEVPLADVKAAAKRLGGSVNDAFVTAAAHAAGVVHREAGQEVDGLRMAMPISTRDGGGMANQFSPSQTVVPCGEMPIAERFALVHEALAQTRAEPAVGAADGVAAAASLLPAPLLRGIGYRMASSVDFVTSNMRAAPFDVYLAGALMTGNYPIGPLAGTAFNMTTMSYRGQLCIGVVTDRAAIPDADGLVRALRQAFKAVVRAR